MYFTYEGAPLSVPPKRALANVEARIRRVEKIGGTLGRDLEAERDAPQHQAHVETMTRYETLHRRYMEYRHGAPKLAEQMRESAPEYCAAVHRESRRWDAEHDDAA
jgi:hypothetical protein